MAKYFEQVLAVDPDLGMLAEGKNKTKKPRIGNIIWQKGSSKELNKLEGPFKLMTMGRSAEPEIKCIPNQPEGTKICCRIQISGTLRNDTMTCH